MKKLGHNPTKIAEDPDVMLLEVRKSLDSKMSAEEEDDSSEDCGGNNCASGGMCMQNNVVITRHDPKCDVCKRHAHNVCIVTDDVRSACFRCFGDDDDA